MMTSFVAELTTVLVNVISPKKEVTGKPGTSM
jgi:hypothetical protein